MTNEEIINPADIINYPPTNQETPAEKYIDTILGKGETPEELQKKFFQILAPSLSLMPISSRRDRQQWLIYQNTTLTLHDICNPHNKINPYLRSQLDGVFLKSLQNASDGGFLLQMLTANTTVIKTQQESIRAPVATGNNANTGFVGKVKRFVTGK